MEYFVYLHDFHKSLSQAVGKKYHIIHTYVDGEHLFGKDDVKQIIWSFGAFHVETGVPEDLPFQGVACRRLES